MVTRVKSNNAATKYSKKKSRKVQTDNFIAFLTLGEFSMPTCNFLDASQISCRRAELLIFLYTDCTICKKQSSPRIYLE